MAFPVTSVLDDFNRADGDPGSNWSPEILNNYLRLTIASNQLTDNSTAFESNYWNASQFGPDCEVYCDIVAMPTNSFSLVARMQNPDNDASVVWYELSIDPTNSYLLKCSSGYASRAQLGANLGVAFSAGDKAGLEVSGSTITAYRYTGGSWSAIDSRTDSDVSGAGYVGIILWNDSTTTIDNFGGGSTSAAPEVVRTVRSSLRW